MERKINFSTILISTIFIILLKNDDFLYYTNRNIKGTLYEKNDSLYIFKKDTWFEDIKKIDLGIIEPYNKILFVYTLIDGKYIGFAPQTEGSNIISLLFPYFEISLEDVFYRF